MYFSLSAHYYTIYLVFSWTFCRLCSSCRVDWGVNITLEACFLHPLPIPCKVLKFHCCRYSPDFEKAHACKTSHGRHSNLGLAVPPDILTSWSPSLPAWRPCRPVRPAPASLLGSWFHSPAVDTTLHLPQHSGVHTRDQLSRWQLHIRILHHCGPSWIPV